MAVGTDANPAQPYGWCDFADVYKYWLRELPDDAVVVEIGSYLGQSAIAWGVAAKARNRPIKLICIDPWHGVDEHDICHDEFKQIQRDILAQCGGSMRPAFEANIAAYGVQDWIDVREGTSVERAAEFADGSVDRVMVDGDHSEASVTADLDAWWPKLKDDGEIVGHDYNWATVRVAVHRWAQARGLRVLPLSARCWRIVRSPRQLTGSTPAPIRRLLVAICSNERTIDRLTVESLLRVLSPLEVAKARMRHEFAAIEPRWYSQHPGVDTLREIAAIDAVRERFSHVLFLDADMQWPDDLLSRILAHHDQGIVSGLYFIKKWPHQPVAFHTRVWNPSTKVWDYNYDLDAVLDESGVLRPEELIGLGCALIPTTVFESYNRPWFQYQRNHETGLSTVTEDVWFCQQARAIGAPIWLDASMICPHISHHPVTDADRLRAVHDLAYIERDLIPPSVEEWQAVSRKGAA